MAKRKLSSRPAGSSSSGNASNAAASSSVDELLAQAMERGGDSLETGRFIVTFKDGANEAGLESLTAAKGMRVADARDFKDQGVVMQDVGDADAMVFPEIGAALVSGNAAKSRGMTAMAEAEADSPYESVDPEYFVFANQVTREYMRTLGTRTEKTSGDYLRGFLAAAELIARELGVEREGAAIDEEVDAEVLGATWGLIACKVPPSVRSGVGIKMAVLDTGFDVGHPDFAGRSLATGTFVGQPVQDLHGHGTHCIGTACGPKAPAGNIPRYGIGYRTNIFAGKVLSNSGSGTTATVLAGMNWGIANRCPVISMSLGAQSPVQPAYTAAGQAALNNGCLIIAAAATTSVPLPAHRPTRPPSCRWHRWIPTSSPPISPTRARLKFRVRAAMCIPLTRGRQSTA